MRLEALLPNDYPQKLREIAAVLFDALIEDLSPGSERIVPLARVAIQQTDRLARELGGESIYLSGLAAPRRAQRDRAIRAAFDGTNRADLALQHGLSEERVRQILAAAQPGLVRGADNARRAALSHPPAEKSTP